MGVDLITAILDAIKETPSLHDLKIQIENTTVHTLLIAQGHPFHSKNKGIKLKMPSLSPNIRVRILVYPNTIQIDLGCTEEPFAFLPAGALKLADVLKNIHSFLCKESLHQAEIPQIGDWILTHHHRGQDSKIHYDGEKFHILLENALGGITRAYSKEGRTGVMFIRVEEIRRERLRIAELLTSMVRSK